MVGGRCLLGPFTSALPAPVFAWCSAAAVVVVVVVMVVYSFSASVVWSGLQVLLPKHNKGAMLLNGKFSDGGALQTLAKILRIPMDGQGGGSEDRRGSRRGRVTSAPMRRTPALRQQLGGRFSAAALGSGAVDGSSASVSVCLLYTSDAADE